MSLNNSLAQKIQEYIFQKRDSALEKYDKEAEKKFNATPEAEQMALKITQTQERKEKEHAFIPKVWLSDAARRASQLSVVSHGIKYLHPDAKGSSFLATQQSVHDSSYISTSSLRKKNYDIVGNAAALDVAKLLMLEDDSAPLTSAEPPTLFDQLRENTTTALRPFTDDDAELEQWKKGFLSVEEVKQPTSHTHAKQVFWPVSAELNCDDYHLLLPLYASSLAHSMYEEIQAKRFSDEAKNARESRKKELPSDTPVVNYLHLARQSFGGTKPQNISQLNSMRGGTAYLLPCSPPSWTPISKPPLNTPSFFYWIRSPRLYGLIKELREFLEDKQEKDINNWDIRDTRRQLLDEIINEVLAHVAAVHTQFSLWTNDENCELPNEQILWLDPAQAEHHEEFKRIREEEKKEWQSAVAQQFARWLMDKLNSKILNLGDPEFYFFKDLFLPEVRLNLKNIAGIQL